MKTENPKPEYHRSEQLQKVKKFVCMSTTEKPRQVVWLTKQLQRYELYQSRSLLTQNIKTVVRDPRTPVEKQGEVVVNTEVDYE